MDIHDYFLNLFFSMFDPIDKEKFNDWIYNLAEKITEVAVEIGDDKLIEIIINDKSFDINYFHYDDNSLRDMFQQEMDIEKAAYKVLSIMKENYSKQNESKNT